MVEVGKELIRGFFININDCKNIFSENMFQRLIELNIEPLYHKSKIITNDLRLLNKKLQLILRDTILKISKLMLRTRKLKLYLRRMRKVHALFLISI